MPGDTLRFDGSGVKPVVVVAGPTASGKSALALALATEFGGTIINADSMQIYCELRILTARPSDADLACAPHRLYGVLPGAEACSAGRWRQLALAAIEEGHEAGLLPIVTGGTGLYLKVLQEGLARIPSVPQQVRDAALAHIEEVGSQAFHRDLMRRDPVMASRLSPNDRQRLVRAWEVLEATGKSLADWQQSSHQDLTAVGQDFRFLTVVLLPPRDWLYEACDRRLLSMLDQGAMAEVAALKALELDPRLPVMKSLGVPEMLRHLAGDLDRGAAVAMAQTKTRRYAKRQFTWLRHQVLRNDSNICLVEAQYSESLLPEIFNFIRQKLLTLDS